MSNIQAMGSGGGFELGSFPNFNLIIQI